jgi:hypothetical protein
MGGHAAGPAQSPISLRRLLGFGCAHEPILGTATLMDLEKQIGRPSQ